MLALSRSSHLVALNFLTTYWSINKTASLCTFSAASVEDTDLPFYRPRTLVRSHDLTEDL